MTITLIILAYVANIFFNRWLNKVMYQKYSDHIIPLVWFSPAPIMLVFFIISYANSIDLSDWFTGKHWKE
jgi:hypothetical protein